MKIYTRTGDTGETALMGGERISKSVLRVGVYGSLDELNSFLGYLVVKVENSQIKSELIEVQKSLFLLGSNIATPKNKRLGFKVEPLSDASVTKLESAIDKMEIQLKAIKNFILPGGCEAAAFCQIVRSVCRRLERELVAWTIAEPNEVPDYASQYVNRLSDYFFVLARYLNHLSGTLEEKWP